MASIKKTDFKCPKCGQNFTYEELFSHNDEVFRNFINSEIDTKVKEFKINLKKEMDDEFEIKQLQLRENYFNETNKLQVEIDSWKNQLKIIEQTKQSEIEKKEVEIKAKLANEYAVKFQKIELSKKDLEWRLSNANNNLSSAQKDYEVKIEEVKLLKNTETQKLISEAETRIVKEYSSKMQEIELSKKDLQSKLDSVNQSFESFKSEQEKNIAIQVLNAKNEMVENNKAKVGELEKKIQELQIINLELDNRIKIQNADTNVKVSQIELEFKNILEQEKNKYDAHIKELEIMNAQNRIINSKVKGENFEQEAEGELRKAFGYSDVISKITTGENKADYLMVVKNHENVEMGRIVYELKNAKWSDAWEKKLSEDMAREGSKYGILVASSFNDKYKEVPFVKSTEYKNIWISDHLSFIFVGQILKKLIEVEFDYKTKMKNLETIENEELLKEYERKIGSLKKFMIENLPIIVSSLKKQYDDLERVSKSLVTNSKMVTKSLEIIKTQIEKKFIKELELITSIEFRDKHNGLESPE